jgi:hypothetical protein
MSYFRSQYHKHYEERSQGVTEGSVEFTDYEEIIIEEEEESETDEEEPSQGVVKHF